ncbi:hypothetical protein, partial [Pseudomonas salomonii]|uniref:hypothetical protein n=1 Tax=Pseudomonas salomonii TaxID=191391 RepID=UPI001C7FA827
TQITDMYTTNKPPSQASQLPQLMIAFQLKAGRTLVNPDGPALRGLIFVPLLQVILILTTRPLALVLKRHRRLGLNRKQRFGRRRCIVWHCLKLRRFVAQVQRCGMDHNRQDGEHCTRQKSPCKSHLKQSAQQKMKRGL